MLMTEAATYDEFSMFEENAREAGLSYDEPPAVDRCETTLEDGRRLSALRWGASPPDLVLLHGGGQNAHTWDTVALALGRPLLAIDLPGHGHSGDTSADRPVGPRSLALDVAVMIERLAPAASLTVGMSLGGLTATSLAGDRPDLVQRLFLVDITPGVNHDKASDIISFLAGPETFASFDEILERTILYNPTRSESSLRRGVLHNSVQLDDGSWVWRHQRGRPRQLEGDDAVDLDHAGLWDTLGSSGAPLTLAKGSESPVVDDDDVAELRRRRPDAGIHVVDGAGHSIQGDRPVELAELIERAIASS